MTGTMGAGSYLTVDAKDLEGDPRHKWPTNFERLGILDRDCEGLGFVACTELLPESVGPRGPGDEDSLCSELNFAFSLAYPRFLQHDHRNPHERTS